MSGGPPVVELTSGDAFARWPEAMRGLDERAAEPNVFSETAFLAPALAHLPEGERARLLLIWEDARRDRLIGRLALTGPRLGVGLICVWRSEQAPLPALTLDRGALDVALEALLGWVRAQRPWLAGILFPRISRDGPTDAALRRAAERNGLSLRRSHELRRAALRLGEGLSFDTDDNRKRAKTWDRYERRLAERGAVVFRAGGEADAMERFLELEARGWKGARGTALVQSPARAAFAREMMAGLAQAGRMRVHELTVGGATIAAGVQLRAEGTAYFWKIAYDEAFAANSPGVLLTRALSRRLEREGEMTCLDSCASGDMPTVDRMWRDRLEFDDIVLTSRSAFGFAVAVWESARPKLRAGVKAAVLPWLRRK